MPTPKIRRIDFSPDEFLAGTLALSDTHLGIYWRACALIYSHGGKVLLSEVRRWSSSRKRDFNDAIEHLLDAGKLTKDGPYVSQTRAIRELERAQARTKAWHENGLKGGRPSSKSNGLEKPGGFDENNRASNHQLPTFNYTEEDKSSSDAGASSKHDPIKQIYDRGVAILGEKRRSLLAKMVKQYGDVTVLAAIVACEEEPRVEPASFFIKACEQRQANGRKRGPLTTLWEGAFNAARKWEETHGDSGDSGGSHVPLLDIRRADGAA